MWRSKKKKKTRLSQDVEINNERILYEEK